MGHHSAREGSDRRGEGGGSGVTRKMLRGKFGGREGVCWVAGL